MRAEGLFDNTLIVVMADHGEEFMDHGLEGHARSLYDELVRIPLIMRIPGLPPARVHELVAASDVAPTILNLLGLGIPSAYASAAAMRVSDAALVAPKDREIFLETRRGADLRGIRRGDYKFILVKRMKRTMLFHLPTDPGERDEIGGEQHTIRRALEVKVKRHNARTPTTAPSAPLSPELTNELKSLGYL
jgi:arylsulfatase A-like enzyme